MLFSIAIKITAEWIPLKENSVMNFYEWLFKVFNPHKATTFISGITPAKTKTFFCNQLVSDNIL